MMVTKKNFFLNVLFIISISIFAFVSASVAEERGDTISVGDEITSCNTGAGETCLKNPLGSSVAAADPNLLIGRIINNVLGITGSLALVMFIYGGLLWMLSGGNAERVTKGKNTLIWAALGLVVVFSAYAIVKFVFEALKVQ